MPEIRFVADDCAPDDDDVELPNTRRTYLFEGIEQIRAALGRLEPGEPLVLGHRLGEQVDLGTYTEILRVAAAAGRDVQLRLESESGRLGAARSWHRPNPRPRDRGSSRGVRGDRGSAEAGGEAEPRRPAGTRREPAGDRQDPSHSSLADRCLRSRRGRSRRRRAADQISAMSPAPTISGSLWRAWPR